MDIVDGRGCAGDGHGMKRHIFGGIPLEYQVQYLCSCGEVVVSIDEETDLIAISTRDLARVGVMP